MTWTIRVKYPGQVSEEVHEFEPGTSKKEVNRVLREYAMSDRTGSYSTKLIYPKRRKNPTKAQKREKTRKASAKRRVAVALAKFLKQANPAGKYAGAKMQRNKGGSITIIPIKLRRSKT
jgi:hypothetical protein